MKNLLIVLLMVFSFCAICHCETTDENLQIAGRQLLEQGRTLVHHAVKRFMIILPAIFFKLGIAFTLLVVVALASVNNGVIGFLLLVVGLSSVLARLQGSGDPRHAIPYIASPVPHHYHQVWDRSSDSGDLYGKGTYTQSQYGPGVVGYYNTAKYAANSHV